MRDFVPLVPGHASVYLCGATVQGEPHIGHVRSGVAFDVLRRWLSAQGLDVAFVRNVTDIDDKILRKAAEAGRPWWEWKSTYERAFNRAYDALGAPWRDGPDPCADFVFDVECVVVEARVPRS